MCYNGFDNINPPYVPTLATLREAGIKNADQLPRSQRFKALMATRRREAAVQAAREKIHVVVDQAG